MHEVCRNCDDYGARGCPQPRLTERVSIRLQTLKARVNDDLDAGGAEFFDRVYNPDAADMVRVARTAGKYVGEIEECIEVHQIEFWTGVSLDTQ